MFGAKISVDMDWRFSDKISKIVEVWGPGEYLWAILCDMVLVATNVKIPDYYFLEQNQLLMSKKLGLFIIVNNLLYTIRPKHLNG